MGLHHSGGYMVADLVVSVYRHVFGDVFHCVGDMEEEEDSESEDENDEGRARSTTPPVRPKSAQERTLLDEHLVRERAANFSPLLK
jgi:hypothetical protein